MGTAADRWRFRTERPGRWVWQRVSETDEITLASDFDFDTLELCAVDAERFGYAGIIGAYADAQPAG